MARRTTARWGPRAPVVVVAAIAVVGSVAAIATAATTDSPSAELAMSPPSSPPPSPSASSTSPGASAPAASPSSVPPSPSPFGSGSLTVRFDEPPPDLPLTPFADVPVADLGPVAIGPLGGVVALSADQGTYFDIDPDGEVTGPLLTNLAAPLRSTVLGPRGVLYGLTAAADGTGTDVVALSIRPGAGGSVAVTEPLTVPLVEADAGSGLDPGGPGSVYSALGSGPTGVIARTGAPGELVMAYVDPFGVPLAGYTAPTSLMTLEAGVITDSVSGRTWAPSVTRGPAAAAVPAGLVDTPPVRFGLFGGDDGVWWTWLDADADGTPSQPVLALLLGDGGGGWYSIPSGWAVVAADTGGVVLARDVGDVVQLARLGDDLGGEGTTASSSPS